MITYKGQKVIKGALPLTEVTRLCSDLFPDLVSSSVNLALEPRCLDRFQSNLVTMTNGRAITRHVTFVTSHVLKGSLPAKKWFSYKMYLVLQTTCNDDVAWSHDSTWSSVYGVYTDLRSKVIKGSFPVWVPKSSKCLFSYKQHAMITWLGHLTRH